jgi:hypothetical protein
MHIALKALGIGPGDEVITPSMTWVSTVNLIVLAGATPVFADVDRETLMVTAETVGEKITGRTRLIIPVHFAGAAVDMAPIRRLAALIIVQATGIGGFVPYVYSWKAAMAGAGVAGLVICLCAGFKNRGVEGKLVFIALGMVLFLATIQWAVPDETICVGVWLITRTV